MPIVVGECYGSRTLIDGQSYEVMYKVTGTEDQVAAVEALKAGTPEATGEYDRGDCQVRLVPDTLDVWDGRVPYAARAMQAMAWSRPLDVGERTISFTTIGGSQRIYKSLATTQSKARPTEAVKNHKNAINVSDHGVEGTDIRVGIFEFDICKACPGGTITPQLIAAIRDLCQPTPHVNAAEFFGFQAGEVLFLGAAGRSRGDAADEITTHFAVDQPETGILIGDIEAIDRKAWEYLWVEFKLERIGTDKTRRPWKAYSEQVYPPGDFDALVEITA